MKASTFPELSQALALLSPRERHAKVQRDLDRRIEHFRARDAKTLRASRRLCSKASVTFTIHGQECAAHPLRWFAVCSVHVDGCNVYTSQTMQVATDAEHAKSKHLKRATKCSELRGTKLQLISAMNVAMEGPAA